MILCELRVGELPPEHARVRDLSECGVKIATPRTLSMGERLRIRLPGTSDWTLARVAWCGGGLAGLAFLRAIDIPRVNGAHPRREASEAECKREGSRAGGGRVYLETLSLAEAERRDR